MLGLLSCKPGLLSEFYKVGNLWGFTAQPISGSCEPPSSLSQSSEYQHGKYENVGKGRRFALWGTVLGEVYFPHYRITCLTTQFNDLSIFIAVQLSDSSSCRAFSSSPETPTSPTFSLSQTLTEFLIYLWTNPFWEFQRNAALQCLVFRVWLFSPTRMLERHPRPRPPAFFPSSRPNSIHCMDALPFNYWEVTAFDFIWPLYIMLP